MASFLEMIKAQRTSLEELKKINVTSEDIKQYNNELEALSYLINLYNSSYPNKAKVASEIASVSMPLSIFKRIHGESDAEVLDYFDNIKGLPNEVDTIMETLLNCVNYKTSQYSSAGGLFTLKKFRVQNNLTGFIRSVSVIAETGILSQMDDEKIYLPDEFGVVIKTMLLNGRSVIVKGNDNFDVKNLWNLIPPDLSIINSIDETVISFVDSDDFIGCFINSGDKDMQMGVDMFSYFMNKNGFSLDNLNSRVLYDIIIKNWGNPLLFKIDFIGPELFYNLIKSAYEARVKQSRYNEFGM